MFFCKPDIHKISQWKNKRVGLLGGSFNPPHIGHVHISKAALKGLKLDAVWWLVTPQNPLKEKPAPLEERVRLCRALVKDRKIIVTDIEKDMASTYTYDTVREIKKRYPETQFVWVSGMDTAQSLPRWHRWKDLLKEIAILHISRRLSKSEPDNEPIPMYENARHVFLDKPGRFPLDSETTYWMVNEKRVDISSTEIRQKMNENQGFDGK